MQFRGGTDQAKHRQEKDLKSAICCIAEISLNIKESSGSPWLVVLTRDPSKLQLTTSSCCRHYCYDEQSFILKSVNYNIAMYI